MGIKEKKKLDYLARKIATEIDEIEQKKPTESCTERNRRLAKKLIDENDFLYMDDVNAMNNRKH